METIGLIGGTSWESTAIYYRLLNEGARKRRGGLHSARIALVSLDFAPLADAMARNDWTRVGDALVEAAGQVQRAGAGCLGLCTNTMHKVADRLVAVTPLPFVNLVDVTGQALVGRAVRRPLLLATRYTMEQAFYRERLQARFGLDPAVPDAADRDLLQAIIFDELCRGVVRDESRQAARRMVAAAARDGCDGVIFGCTEIGMLLSAADLPLPVFDTTALHCDALLDVAFSTLPAAARPAA